MKHITKAGKIGQSWKQVAICKPTHRFLTDLDGLLRPLWCIAYLQEDLYIMIYKFKLYKLCK